MDSSFLENQTRAGRGNSRGSGGGISLEEAEVEKWLIHFENLKLTDEIPAQWAPPMWFTCGFWLFLPLRTYHNSFVRRGNCFGELAALHMGNGPRPTPSFFPLYLLHLCPCFWGSCGAWIFQAHFPLWVVVEWINTLYFSFQWKPHRWLDMATWDQSELSLIWLWQFYI